METDAMLIEYRDETTPRVRLFIAVVVTPFMVILAMNFILAFGLFGRDALDLVGSMLRGDFTRLGDFVGYLALLLLCVGIPCVFIYASISKGVFAPNVVVTIDPSRQIVSICRGVTWQSSRHAEYAFSDVAAIELANSSLTASEQNEISLRIRSLKRPLVLVATFDAQAAAQEFQKLKEIGLPSR
ncbi:hypothetical protein CLV80_102228 [Yoonia maritima]|uniref:PH (Pleckstrin Homology) domain-containing protein n=1 Tax=Yoonia maritima TaxID=1435347 RepID=A0A2T0W320_9RHOB|nr:hypothetical protein [Yoonia maritima]PRY79583.1 hypothetical protein CLV80_102228 [Yoonia maritima]